jgi:hypothetical protein
MNNKVLEAEYYTSETANNRISIFVQDWIVLSCMSCRTAWSLNMKAIYVKNALPYKAVKSNGF